MRKTAEYSVCLSFYNPVPVQFTSHRTISWRSTPTFWLSRDTRSCWVIALKSVTSLSALRRPGWRTEDSTGCPMFSSGVFLIVLSVFTLSVLLIDNMCVYFICSAGVLVRSSSRVAVWRRLNYTRCSSTLCSRVSTTL